MIEADPVAALLGWTPSVLRVVAAAAVASSAYLLVFGLRGPIRIGGFSLVPPSKTARSQPARTDFDPALGRGHRAVGSAAADSSRLRCVRGHLLGRYRAGSREPRSRRRRRFRTGGSLGLARPRAFGRRRGGAAGVSRRLLRAAAGHLRRPVRLFRGPPRGRAAKRERGRTSVPRRRPALADFHRGPRLRRGNHAARLGRDADVRPAAVPPVVASAPLGGGNIAFSRQSDRRHVLVRRPRPAWIDATARGGWPSR